MRILIVFLMALSVGHAQQIKVMTYNLRYDNPGDGINQWGSRKEKVFFLIKKYDPDVIGVQEALAGQLKDIVNALPGYTFIGVGRDDGKEKGEFSAILYKKDRFDIKTQNTFWLSEAPDVPGSKSWDAAITRVVTYARFQDKKTSAEFMFFNTHFDHIGKEARLKSAALIKTKAAELSQQLPTLITGDFNCTREEPPYQEMMSSTGLKVMDPLPGKAIGTFCTFDVNGPACRAIDYIFYTSEWKAADYNVITDNDGKNYPSDHLPVMTTFSLKK